VEGPTTSVGTVVTSLSVQPYERTESRALILSLLFDAAIFVLIVAGARLVVGRALRPVAQMTESAAAWSEHDLDHRFDLGPPTDELMELAATFDHMLDRLAASLRHERRFSAEISHELRTPLSAIVAETELALKQEREPARYRQALKRIAAKGSELERILESLLAAARVESSDQPSAIDVGAAVERVRDSFAAPGAGPSRRIETERPSGSVLVDADEEMVARILSPLVENACRYASTRILLAVDADVHSARVSVVDDGPGVPAGELESIFEPGVRGTAADESNGNRGAGLGLALSRRLARAVGGEVKAVPTDHGARFEVTLPLSPGGGNRLT
jgi:signal transduction histidine kinase